MVILGTGGMIICSCGRLELLLVGPSTNSESTGLTVTSVMLDSSAVSGIAALVVVLSAGAYTRDMGLKHVPEKVNNSDCKHPNFCHVLLVINK